MGDGEPRRSSHAKQKRQGSAKKASSSSSGGGNKARRSLSANKKKKSPEDILRDGGEYLERMDDSPFFTAHPARTFPNFERTELGLGKKLGSGAFCNVHEILAMRLNPEKTAAGGGIEGDGEEGGDGGGGNDVDCADTAPSTGHSRLSTTKDTSGGGGGGGDNSDDDDDGDDDDDENEFEHYDMIPSVVRAYMSDQCLRDGDARYAVKRLRADLSEYEKSKGIVDLAVEAKFLASIHHPNVVKMRGGSSCPDPLTIDNFIVMDRLYDTLEERIDQWDVRKKMGSGGCMGCIGGGGNKEEFMMLMVERLTAAYDVASVFRYLHEKKLVYRDIKPDNMGFDVRGDIKVFDFGLCKELTTKLRTKDGLYNLTGLTGSRRYMAPEVVLCKPYNETADVFSFGILLWQILALAVPFVQFDPRDHTEQVVKGGYRPPVQSSWPVMTRGIMKECWDANLKERPDFVRIASVLKGEMSQLAADSAAMGGAITNRTSHMMKRSQHSFRLHARGSGSNQGLG